MARIEERQAALSPSDQVLCAAVGFDREVVWTMIRTGYMKMPLTRVAAFAQALSMDVSELFKAVMLGTSPELAALIETVYNPMHLTPREKHLIERTKAPLQALTAAPKTVTSTQGAAA